MKTENKITKHKNSKLKAKIIVLNTENIVLNKENTVLNKENTELKAKLKALGGINDICRHCGKPNGNFLYVGPSKDFPQFAMPAKFYKCENCGKEYEKPNQL